METKKPCGWGVERVLEEIGRERSSLLNTTSPPQTGVMIPGDHAHVSCADLPAGPRPSSTLPQQIKSSIGPGVVGGGIGDAAGGGGTGGTSAEGLSARRGEELLECLATTDLFPFDDMLSALPERGLVRSCNSSPFKGGNSFYVKSSHNSGRSRKGPLSFSRCYAVTKRNI